VIYRLSPEYHLRDLLISDTDGPYAGWFQDQEVCKFNSHGKFFPSRADLLAYVEGCRGADRVVMAIVHAQDGHVGNVSLQAISGIDRTAEFAILLGDRRHWRHGLGELAGRALLAHGFYKLNLERIHCGTAATNTGMQQLALRLGMREEGRRRAAVFLEGQRVDVVEYGILRDEFRVAGN
jgi:[ribosomal protein S5]-alanine N-acetyltransferase